MSYQINVGSGKTLSAPRKFWILRLTFTAFSIQWVISFLTCQSQRWTAEICSSQFFGMSSVVRAYLPFLLPWFCLTLRYIPGERTGKSKLPYTLIGKMLNRPFMHLLIWPGKNATKKCSPTETRAYPPYSRCCQMRSKRANEVSLFMDWQTLSWLRKGQWNSYGSNKLMNLYAFHLLGRESQSRSKSLSDFHWPSGLILIMTRQQLAWHVSHFIPFPMYLSWVTYT